MGQTRSYRWILQVAFFLALMTSPYALSSANDRTPIPASLQNRSMHPTILRLEHDPDLHCPNGIFEHLSSSASISEIVRKLDFSPQCIWKTIRKNAATRSERVQGFGFGSVSEVSMTGGIGIATELVVMKYDEKTLMVGQVYSESGVVVLGLPGVSLTQSVIFGSCPDALFGYLGWFDTFSALAISRSFGKSEYHLPGAGTYSGCNALSSTRGTTTPILGASQSYYHQEAPFVLVRGPRISALLRYLAELNHSK